MLYCSSSCDGKWRKEERTLQRRRLQQVRTPPAGQYAQRALGQMTSSPAPHADRLPWPLSPWVHGKRGPMVETPCPSSRVPRHLPRAPHQKEKEERQPRAAAALWSGLATGGGLLPSPLPSRVTRGVAGKVQAREIQTGRWWEAGRDVIPIDWRELKPCIPSVEILDSDPRPRSPPEPPPGPVC